MGTNANTTNCEDCGAEVSYRASTCSNCGAPGPDDPSVTVTGVGLFLLIIGIGGVVAGFVLPLFTPVLLLGLGLFFGGSVGMGRKEYREENDSSRS